MIQDLNKINIDFTEGKLLMAAIAIITTESQRDKTPNEVLEKCNVLAAEMYKYLDDVKHAANQNRNNTLSDKLKIELSLFLNWAKSNHYIPLTEAKKEEIINNYLND